MLESACEMCPQTCFGSCGSRILFKPFLFWNALEIGELVALAQSSSRSLLNPPVALALPELTDWKVT